MEGVRGAQWDRLDGQKQPLGFPMRCGNERRLKEDTISVIERSETRRSRLPWTARFSSSLPASGT